MIIILAEFFGAVSLVLFGAFLFFGPVVSMTLGLADAGALYWDAMLSFLFFAQHSLMVRQAFKDRLATVIHRDFHAAIYAIASGVILAAVILLWQPTPVLLTAPPAVSWSLRAIALLAIAGFVWGVRALRTFDTFGRRPIAARLRGEALPDSEFVLRGPYLWVRHPLMTFMIVLIWCMPAVSADRVLFNVLWTAWMVIAARWEERDLVTEFGETYRQYQHVVPRLLPWRGPAGKILQQEASDIPHRPSAA